MIINRNYLKNAELRCLGISAFLFFISLHPQYNLQRYIQKPIPAQ